MLQWLDVLRLANNGNPQADRRLEKTEAEWKALLSPEQFRITRLKGTERAYSSDLCNAFEAGRYACVCCETPLFDSNEKFQSGTGWPSFTQPVEPTAIAYHKDKGFGMYRIEAVCNTCDAHLGHVFQDGPAPSRLRYCINAEALKKTNSKPTESPAMPIGLGTAAIGRPQYINIRQEVSTDFSLDAFRAKGMTILDAAYDQGVRYFDTAPGYGMAEKLLMDWVIQKNDPTIEVATKWGYTYVANFDPTAKQHEVKEHSLAKLNEQWAVSQQLLPWLTTYQIHSATFETGVLENEEILHRLAELKNQEGLLIGISTTGANQVEVIKKALEVEVDGAALFDVFQATYNVFDQSVRAISAALHQRNKRLVIKEALANGRAFPNKNYPNYVPAFQLLLELAEKYGQGLDAIALRFCLDSVDVYKVLSGASNSPHLQDNLKTAGFELEAQDVEAIKALAVEPMAYWNERKQLAWN